MCVLFRCIVWGHDVIWALLYLFLLVRRHLKFVFALLLSSVFTFLRSYNRLSISRRQVGVPFLSVTVRRKLPVSYFIVNPLSTFRIASSSLSRRFCEYSCMNNASVMPVNVPRKTKFQPSMATCFGCKFWYFLGERLGVTNV
jgi:hypothetical protein